MGPLTISLMAMGALAAAGMLAERRSRRRVLHAHPPPGEVVVVDGHGFHVHRTGSGRPAVVLEAGSGSFSMAWHGDSSKCSSYT